MMKYLVLNNENSYQRTKDMSETDLVSRPNRKKKKKIKLSEYLRNYILNRLGVRATPKYRLYPCVSRPQLFCFG